LKLEISFTYYFKIILFQLFILFLFIKININL
jgi:hypothetical protein